MKIKWWTPLAVVLGVSLSLCVGSAGQQDIREYVLFGGSNVDSNEIASPWISVRGANRIIIRTWTSKSAFGNQTEADSLFSDSISTFKTLWSDSVSFIGRDSLGSIVQVRSYTSQAGRDASFPVCADSVMYSGAYQDSGSAAGVAVTSTGIDGVPVNIQLRGPSNGSGTITQVFVVAPNGVATYGDGSFQKQFMRIRITPLRRMTSFTSGAIGCTTPCGNRVNGLKGLRMRAYVIYQNK